MHSLLSLLSVRLRISHVQQDGHDADATHPECHQYWSGVSFDQPEGLTNSQ